MQVDNPRPFSKNTEAGSDPAWGESLSSLMDDELEAERLDEVLLACREDSSCRSSWAAYHVVSEVLRERTTMGSSSHSGARLTADIMAALARECPPVPVPVLPSQNHVLNVPVREPAANDAVFRWRMVAGLASIAAMVAVAWGLTGEPSSPGAAGPQWVQAPVSSQAIAPALSSSPALSPQGPVIRDPRLEELLAEHRQHGGLSALQMPTGFMRNATYDAPRR